MSSKLLAGYWHNFVNEAGTIPLTKIPDAYDIVNIAFATPALGSTSEITFSIFDGNEAKFAADVTSLQKRGKQVLLSIGGSDAVVQLKNKKDVSVFVKSVSALVDKYAFDGIDIDFENDSLFLDIGDTDLHCPTTPVVVNLIAALHSLKKQFGSRFKIAMAPETFFVQQGLMSYGAERDGADRRAGCALPVLAELPDIISYLWVQQYNSGPMPALDGETYSAGSIDFHVAMSEVLLTGFIVASECTNAVAPFDEAKMLIGIPSSRHAGAGFLPSAGVCKALTCLVAGKDFDGRYRLRRAEGYPRLGGVMMWSINWDVYAGCEMSTSIRACLDSLADSTWCMELAAC